MEAEDPGRDDDLVFIESLPMLVRRSDDSATWLGLASCSCEGPWVPVTAATTATLVFLALALALSPVRLRRLLLLPLLKEDDDLEFELSPLVEARLTEEVDEGLRPGGEDTLTLTAECLPPGTMFLGLFCPVLLVAGPVVVLVVVADSLWPAVRMEGSEGNRDIIGGLGGRADVNFCWDSAPALVFFLSRLGDGLGDSFFSKTGESWSLLPPLLGALRRPLTVFIAPGVDFFEVVVVVSTTFRAADGLFGATEVKLFDFLVEAGGLLFPAVD